MNPRRKPIVKPRSARRRHSKLLSRHNPNLRRSSSGLLRRVWSRYLAIKRDKRLPASPHPTQLWRLLQCPKLPLLQRSRGKRRSKARMRHRRSKRSPRRRVHQASRPRRTVLQHSSSRTLRQRLSCRSLGHISSRDRTLHTRFTRLCTNSKCSHRLACHIHSITQGASEACRQWASMVTKALKVQ